MKSALELTYSAGASPLSDATYSTSVHLCSCDTHCVTLTAETCRGVGYNLQCKSISSIQRMVAMAALDVNYVMAM